MTKSRAVLISDIHYNINTLPLADASLRMAISKANELNVPLVVAGDLHDTKAHLRGECIKALLDTFSLCKTTSYVIVGNHDRLHEKKEAHSLEFLRGSVSCIVDHPTIPYGFYRTVLLPYYHDKEELARYLYLAAQHVNTLIMHQGVEDSHSGEYIQDKSALSKSTFKDFRVISGHYHTRQDIKCGPPRKGAVGLFSYIGNPFTLNFAEANDPPKGFQILNDDGTLTFVPTNLRKHVILARTLGDLYSPVPNFSPGDLVKLKLSGPQSLLQKVSKQEISDKLFQGHDFRLDKEVFKEGGSVMETSRPDSELLDGIIDSLKETEEQKQILKGLWRGVLNEES